MMPMRAGFLRLMFLLFVGVPVPGHPSEDRPRTADLIVTNGYVVTMNAGKEIHSPGAVVIRDGKIVAVGPAEVAEGFRAVRVIDAGGDIVLPGLINTHTHISMSVFRGLADDVPDRLRRFIFPLEKAMVDRELVYWGALHGAVEMIEAGVTTFVDMYYFEDEVARAAKEAGMRAIVGETIIGFPSPDSEEPYGGLAYARHVAEKYRGDPLITPALAPHAPDTMDAENLRAVAAAAEALDVPVLIHLAETEEEVARVRQQANQTPVEYLDLLGLLNHRLVAAHCIYVTDSDIELLKARDVGVAHNMAANIKSAKAVAPALKMFQQGVRIGLGTDGPMSGNTLDVIGQMGYVSKLHKLANKDRSVMPAVDVVEMATIGGARALHLEDKLGSLEPGKLADLVIIDKDATNMIPFYDVYATLVYAASAKDVRTTIINGRLVMEDRVIKTVDTGTVREKIRSFQDKIAAAAAKL